MFDPLLLLTLLLAPVLSFLTGAFILSLVAQGKSASSLSLVKASHRITDGR